ncbi:MAG: FkbM family methyltransferase [Verrucomicrobiae bacterium]|nr:FkbM family methyltransferase [Verrucomicrobiae bacterium]
MDKESLQRRIRRARAITRWLPLILAQRARELLLPYREVAKHTDLVESESLHGTRLLAPLNDRHQYRMLFHGCYDWRNACVARVLCRTGEWVIEIGANVGTETLDLCGVVGPSGRVVAYEPNPGNAELLEMTLRNNALQNVTLHRCALGTASGRMNFQLPENKAESGLGHLLLPESSSPGSRLGKSIEVECRSLDQEKLPAAAAVFIDVEGWECAVLEGGERYLQKNKPPLVLEASETLQQRAGRTVSELAGMVRDLGYRIWTLGRWGVRPRCERNSPGAHGNWLCLEASQGAQAVAVGHSILRAYILPPIPGLHPLRQSG